MPNQHIQHISFWKWFPANDPVATSVARLCILREDLYLETLALIEESLPPLDKNTAVWRMTYFWRNSVRTLFEIRSAIEILYSEDEFRNALESQPLPLRDAFKSLKDEIVKAHGVLKPIRNSIGGHVLQQAVKKGLSNMDFGRGGLIELGERVHDTHYRFVSELLGVVWLGENPGSEWKEEIEKTVKLIAELSRALETIDIVFDTYMRSRRLLD